MKSEGAHASRAGVKAANSAQAKSVGVIPHALWYQEILDRIADEEKHVVRFPSGDTIGGDALPWMHEIEAVALALDALDRTATKAAVKKLVADHPSLLLPYVISESLDHEMVARAFALGLSAEATQLLQYFRARSRASYFQQGLSRSYAEDRKLWERVTSAATATTPKSAADASAVLTKLLPIFGATVRESAELDPAQVQADYEMRRDSSMRIYAGPYDQSISEYWLSLKGLLDKQFILLESCEQLLIDAAAAQLAAGKGTAALGSARKAHEDITTAAAKVQSATLDITKSAFHKKGSRHFDFFGGKADSSRAIGISFFDPAQTEGEEMTASYGEVLAARAQQLAFLDRLYGVPTKSSKSPDDSANNAAAIKAMGGHLRLHNNDDWRRFLAEKLKLMRAAGVSDADALDRMLDLIHAYFSAYTVHTPYNIDEFGDNYLTRSFPRTLSGQLLHDCGVYALRIVYMLSLVRRELHLDIRFVVLPAHVGLILTGDAKAPALPTYIVHNNSFHRIAPDELASLREQLRTHDPTGAELKAPQKSDDARFLGELGAGLYAAVSSPYRTADVAQLTAGNTAALEQKYFGLYHERALTPVLNDKTVELRYVQFVDKSRSLGDRVRPLWTDTAPTLWAHYRTPLLDALTGYQHKTSSKASYLAQRDAYLAELQKAVTPLDEIRWQINDERIEIENTLAQHPGLTAKGAHVFPFSRGLTFSKSDAALHQLVQYIVELARDTDLDDPAKSSRLEPPFVTAAGRKLFSD